MSTTRSHLTDSAGIAANKARMLTDYSAALSVIDWLRDNRMLRLDGMPEGDQDWTDARVSIAESFAAYGQSDRRKLRRMLDATGAEEETQQAEQTDALEKQRQQVTQRLDALADDQAIGEEDRKQLAGMIEEATHEDDLREISGELDGYERQQIEAAERAAADPMAQLIDETTTDAPKPGDTMANGATIVRAQRNPMTARDTEATYSVLANYGAEFVIWNVVSLHKDEWHATSGSYYPTAEQAERIYGIRVEEIRERQAYIDQIEAEAHANADAGIAALELIADAVRDAGSLPAGELYAVLIARGCSKTLFDQLIEILIECETITKHGDRLQWKGGPQKAYRINATINGKPVSIDGDDVDTLEEAAEWMTAFASDNVDPSLQVWIDEHTPEGTVRKIGVNWMPHEQPEPEPTPEDIEEARQLELCCKAARLLGFDHVQHDPITDTVEGHHKDAGPPELIAYDFAELDRICEQHEQHERA